MEENVQTIIVKEVEKKKNKIGVAGFILAILAIVFGWVPVLDWILWALGLILSLVGVFRKPRGLAIAGLCVSCLGIILILLVFGALLGLAAL